MTQSLQIPSEAVIQNVMATYERGLTVDALRQAEHFAALLYWDGIDSCVLAARIAANAGAPRLASRLSVRAWRTGRSHAAAQLQFGFQLYELRGPLAAWRTMRGWETSPQASVEDRAELLALRAFILADLRDFATSEMVIKQAEELCCDKPWIRLQRAHLLERQDHIEEALEIAQTASALHPFPFYRPGVQIAAHLLQLLDRDEDAIQLLKQAGAVLQNGPVAGQLYGLLSNNGRWEEADAALSRFIEMSPLLELPLQKWVTSQRARIAYHLCKRDDAAKFARELDDDFHQNFVKNLESAPNGATRVQLEVSFVRQHFKTCAPATLAALGQFWRMPAEHLKLAEAMCYDGTPSWQQRDWAERNGWLVREFRATHESILALTEAGIPFAISTVDATSAHMQAVVGFDRTRGTILLRDPSQPYIVEAFAETFFAHYRPFGPHGMVFLPAAEGSRVDGIELADTEIYDRVHCFKLCLNKHDRCGAAKILQAMSYAYDGHELVWETRLMLAGYDANVSEQLRCLDKLLELFPNDPVRLLMRLGCLRNASRQERVEFLERICQAKDADPALFIELARALGEDARCVPSAARWLKRALRFRPLDSNAIAVQADLLWADENYEEATELYRFAASLEGYRENLYQTWFSACRHTRRTKEALALLEDRYKRFGARSEQPGMTLAWAWRELDQPQRAREIYAEASRLRPDDGYLLLNAASLEARLRNLDETEKFLYAAKDKVRKTDWLRAKAEIAEWRLDTATSLQIARDILEIEPLALDAHGGVARGLAQLEGTASALAYLKSACADVAHGSKPAAAGCPKQCGSCVKYWRKTQLLLGGGASLRSGSSSRVRSRTPLTRCRIWSACVRAILGSAGSSDS
jgi:cellulose synthase operon protein C